MKMNYSYNEMKRAFECGRNFQLTGENNFQELIEELNQALPQTDVSKRSQIQFEIGQLLYQINSRYGAYGHIEPSLEKQKEIYDRIVELREQLKNGC